MTHAEAFAGKTSETPRDPEPNCPGRLDTIGRYWGKEPVEVMKVRHLYQCRRCRALIGFVGDVVTWVQAGAPE